MKAAIICFTFSGIATAEKIREALHRRGDQVSVCCKKKDYHPAEGAGVPAWEGSLSDWTGAHFSEDSLIFVGATGIAVRAIAPFVASKTSDPAVLCCDEKGHFLISLLSGHIGGANEVTMYLAKEIGAVPVITTATDINGKFAVDVFAGKNNLWISDMTLAKEISSALLDGQMIDLYIDRAEDWKIRGNLPAHLRQVDHPEQIREETLSLWIGEQPDGSQKNERCLYLCPRDITLGIGCRKGKDKDELEAFVTGQLERAGISAHRVSRVCSIDLKKEEEAILFFCRNHKLPYVTYSAEQLREVKGEFTPSSFVAQTTGVDNVCERSALAGCPEGELILRKTACNGMTLAAAGQTERILTFV